MVLLTEVNNIVVVNPIVTGFGHRQVTVTLARARTPEGDRKHMRSGKGDQQGKDHNRTGMSLFEKPG